MVTEARKACFDITGARIIPIPTLLPSETCTKTPLDRPKKLKSSSAATQISPTRLKPPKMAVFAANSPQRVFWRNPSRQAAILDLKASFALKGWLRNAAAHACSFASQGHFFGLETGTYGHHSVRAGALDAQTGAQTPQLVFKHPGRFRPRFGSFRSPWCCYGRAPKSLRSAHGILIMPHGMDEPHTTTPHLTAVPMRHVAEGSRSPSAVDVHAIPFTLHREC